MATRLAEINCRKGTLYVTRIGLRKGSPGIQLTIVGKEKGEGDWIQLEEEAVGLLTTILGTWYSKAARKGLTHQDGEVFPYLKFSSHSPGVLWLHTGEGRCTNLTRQQATHLSKGLREWVDCEEVHKNSLSGSGQ